MPNKLSDWKWAIDYTEAFGQKDATMRPLLFTSRKKAQFQNKCSFPKGRIVKVKISILKK